MDPGSTAVVVVVVVVVVEEAAVGEEDALLAVSGGMPGVGTRNHKVVIGRCWCVLGVRNFQTMPGQGQIVG